LDIIVPIPIAFIEVIWFALGLTFGRGFGKSLDADIQNSAWFKAQSEFVKWIVCRFLDVFHHWWIGALLMLYSVQIVAQFPFLGSGVAVYWFGAGLLADDVGDVPNRLKKISEKLKK
jgi:hypothetical protein